MNKLLWSSVLALAAAAFLTACGDETTNVTETTGLASVDKFKNLAECTAENEGELVYVKDSAKAYLCAASEWTNLNAAVVKGSDGKDGVDGKDGKDGTDGKNGKDGASCTVKPIEGGYKVLCGGDSVGVLLNGAKGDSGAQGVQGKSGENCTVKANKEKNGYDLTCDGKVVTVTNGSDGESVIDSQGESCTGKTLENGDIQISCGKDFTGVLHNGTDGKEGKSAYEIAKEEDPTITDVASWLESLKGDPGTSCTATALSDSSGFELTCGGNVIGTISNGKDGADGKGFMDGWMVDPRDKQLYRVVTIGEQTWMAENLNYKVDSSFCYNDSLEYCEKYGRLYKWAAAVDKSEEECGYGNVCRLSGKVRGVCPEGWHLPDTTEWITLFTGVGGQFVGAGVQWTAGNILKSQTGWNNDGNGTDDDDNMNELMSQMGWNGNGDGSDAYGFSAIPSGYRNSYGFFRNNSSYFWSASENDGDYAYCMSLFYYIENASLSFGEKSEASSVRCLKN